VFNYWYHILWSMIYDLMYWWQIYNQLMHNNNFIVRMRNVFWLLATPPVPPLSLTDQSNCSC
jgi:hypothetical protein